MAEATDKMFLRKSKKPNILVSDMQSPTMTNVTQLASSTDSKLKVLSEMLVNKLADLERRLMECIKSISVDINSVRTELSGVMDKLVEVDLRVSTDINKIHTDVSGALNKIVEVDSRVSGCEDRSSGVEKNLNNMSARINFIENNAVLSDLVVHGVPNNANIDVMTAGLLSMTKCDRVLIRDAFRIGDPSDNSKCRPVIVKLSTPHDRIKILKALANFRKSAKRQLICSDVGISGIGNLSIYESLTLGNRMIMQTALKLKRDNCLHSVFSLRGLVYVRDNPNNEATKILDLRDLDKFIGGPGN